MYRNPLIKYSNMAKSITYKLTMNNHLFNMTNESDETDYFCQLICKVKRSVRVLYFILF
jgi:hypothetical protein